MLLQYSPPTLVRVYRKKKIESESLQTNKNLLKLLSLAKEFIDLLSEKKAPKPSRNRTRTSNDNDDIGARATWMGLGSHTASGKSKMI